ncbi:hypothetical protein AAFP35_01395 [Gordonia sp. CPCC 206044]|uniref:hypothetical protein n=1 Tax=Gordonia sp. CPCC 206044 TaxID=3140793 RepID=UPI003AF355C0
MALVLCDDVTPAEWITRSGESWNVLALYGPPGFDAYARLRFASDPEYAGQKLSDARPCRPGVSDTAVLAQLCAVLAGETTTPDDCYFAMWDGYGTVRELPRVGRMSIPNRKYHLFCGALADVGDWGRSEAVLANEPAAFIWPADHAWCIACDTDPHWAGIGAARHVIDALLAQRDVDVVAADRSTDFPFYTA